MNSRNVGRLGSDRDRITAERTKSADQNFYCAELLTKITTQNFLHPLYCDFNSTHNICYGFDFFYTFNTFAGLIVVFIIPTMLHGFF